MPVYFSGILEDVKAYEGKNGFGANVTISSKIGKRTKRIEFRVNEKATAEKLESLLGEEVTIKIELEQNSFGLRLGNLLEVA